VWRESRQTLQPLFTARRIDVIAEAVARAVTEAVDDLAARTRPDRPVDMGTEVSTIVCRVVMRVLFDDKVSVADALRIVAAQNTIATAILVRLLVPFVPNAVPLPGDRAFNDAVRTIDDILLPVVRASRAGANGGDDIVATLSRATTADGAALSERQVRNDTVAMFATTTETVYSVLTFLWPILDATPEVSDRLYEEIDRVVGDGPARPVHLPGLVYTRMVLDELVRLYPVGWMIPRTAAETDVIDGVRIPGGADILISPYITQRMQAHWENPAQFDPQRFAPGPAARRHRYAHFPFGGGAHQCLGQHLFYLEAQLIVAEVVRRFRFRAVTPGIPAVRVGASLRPRDQAEVVLRPRDGSSAP
jgi:cytochrome P450